MQHKPFTPNFCQERKKEKPILEIDKKKKIDRIDQ